MSGLASKPCPGHYRRFRRNPSRHHDWRRTSYGNDHAHYACRFCAAVFTERTVIRANWAALDMDSLPPVVLTEDAQPAREPTEAGK